MSASIRRLRGSGGSCREKTSLPPCPLNRGWHDTSNGPGGAGPRLSRATATTSSVRSQTVADRGAHLVWNYEPNGRKSGDYVRHPTATPHDIIRPGCIMASVVCGRPCLAPTVLLVFPSLRAGPRRCRSRGGEFLDGLCQWRESTASSAESVAACCASRVMVARPSNSWYP